MKALIAAVALWLVVGVPVRACSCLAPPPPDKAFAEASVVFAGKVESIQRTGEHDVKVTMQVKERWKGTNANTRSVVVHTARSSAACGYSFENGKEYLVYAYTGRGDRPGEVRTSLCTRTARLADASEDLRFLRKEAKPAAP